MKTITCPNPACRGSKISLYGHVFKVSLASSTEQDGERLTLVLAEQIPTKKRERIKPFSALNVVAGMISDCNAPPTLQNEL